MRRAVAAIALLASGCQAATRAQLPLIELSQAKSEPDRFLAEFEGKRVRIAGYLFNPHFLPHCDAPFYQSGNDVRDTYVDLPYSDQKTFQASFHQRIVVEATVRKPKRFRFGGGDLYFQPEAFEQDFYLDDAKLISIDTSAPRCQR